jgi:hypothetical protein
MTTLSDSDLNSQNEVDIQKELNNRTSQNIIINSTDLVDGDLLQYDDSVKKFLPVTPLEIGLYAPGGTDVAIVDGGTGASTAAAAKTNLGIGNISSQASTAVAITGGTITGITDLAVADGGTGASTLTGVLLGNGTSAITAESPLSVSKGGLGVTSLTAYGVVCAGTTKTAAVQSISPGTTNYVLMSNGAAALPSFQDANAFAGSEIFISTQTASNSATIDFTGLSSTYIRYVVRIFNLVPSTDDTTLYCRVGTGAGPTYDSSGVYNYANSAVHSVSTLLNATGASQTQFLITPTGSGLTNCGNNTGENLSGTVEIQNPSQSSLYHLLNWDYNNFSSGATPSAGFGGGAYVSATAVTAVRFLMSSGSIASGVFTLYGIKNS